MAGKGKLTHTGQLGEVMQESIQAAMTVVRSRSALLGLDVDFYQKADVPHSRARGARRRRMVRARASGMCTSLISALTKIPVRSDVAMTGEITLRGEVLPIGGLKEKLLAAHRGGITTVLIPDDNTKDLAEIPDNIKEKLDIRSVKWIDEVLQVALTHMPVPLPVVDAEGPGSHRRREAPPQAGARQESGEGALTSAPPRRQLLMAERDVIVAE